MTQRTYHWKIEDQPVLQDVLEYHIRNGYVISQVIPLKYSTMEPTELVRGFEYLSQAIIIIQLPPAK